MSEIDDILAGVGAADETADTSAPAPAEAPEDISGELLFKEEDLPYTEASAEGGSGDDDDEPRKPFSDALEWVGSLVYAVLAVLVLNLFFFRSITVQGGSMENTLEGEDKVIATNFLYTPQRGDIVVVQADKIQNYTTKLYGEPIIKRVIALEGDTVSFDFDKGEVYLNGELLEEDYIAEPTLNPEGRVSGVEYVVPEHCVFVMGDNRNVSLDSRSESSLGFVDVDLIMGKAFFRVYPFDKMGLL